MINNREIEFLNMETITNNEPTKEDLQKRKLQLQIETLEEKKKAQQQKQQQINYKDISKSINGLIYVLLAPILIIGFFFIECAKQSSRSGHRRR